MASVDGSQAATQRPLPSIDELFKRIEVYDRATDLLRLEGKKIVADMQKLTGGNLPPDMALLENELYHLERHAHWARFYLRRLRGKR